MVIGILSVCGTAHGKNRFSASWQLFHVCVFQWLKYFSLAVHIKTNQFLQADKYFLPVDKYFLPADNYFLPADNYFLPADKYFLPVEIISQV